MRGADGIDDGPELDPDRRDERQAEHDDRDELARLDLERDDRLREYAAGAAWPLEANTDRRRCPAETCDLICGPFTGRPCECPPCACPRCQTQRRRAVERSRHVIAVVNGIDLEPLCLFDQETPR